MTALVPLVEVTRTDVRSGRALVESVHVGSVVVVDGDGAVVAGLGEVAADTFVRSTAKPFQVTACLELLGIDGPALRDDELAVAQASHRAEPVHLAAVSRLLARSGTRPEALTCPPAPGEHDPGASPSRVRHNCSGKHALFALTGRHQGTPRERLLDPEGPLQRVVLDVLEDALGPATAVGVDGCGAPAVAVPLHRLALGFAHLAVDPRWVRVRQAAFAHPHLVGGEGRLETALLAAGVTAKVGAEGVFAAGWLAPDGTPRGVAVKAADGAARAATTATLAVLAAQGVVPASLWAPEPVLGGGEPAGSVRATAAVAELTA